MANILESPTNIEDEAFEEEINVEREDFELVVPENYDDLLGLPQINGVTLTGNKTSSDLGIITQEQVDNAIQTESQARSSADTELNNKINAESTARGEADTALGTRIDDEALARQSADNGLQSQIDAITSKSDVVDVVANYAALQAYDTSTLGNNDVVKVLDDETHEDALTYYRWSTTTQTWSYIGQEAPYYSKGQMDVKLAEKQDKLTAGANIQIQNGTISATDTTYTAGNGLNLNGTEFSADTDVLATKEDLEDYYTKTETDTKLAPKLETEVVAELPSTGAGGKLYLTPKAHTTQTATGNPITATVAEEAGKIESFQLDGDTYQQSYEGKNLFEYIPADNEAQGLISTIDSNGVVTVTGTGTARWSDISQLSNNASPSGTYTITISTTGTGTLPRNISLRLADGNNSNLQTVTVGINESVTETLVAHTKWRVFLATDADVVYNCKIKIQVEAGSDSTSFEPYVGGTPSPNPDYPQPIQTVTGLQTVAINGTDYPLDLGDIQLCGLGDDGNGKPLYEDYIYQDFDEWKLHKATGQIVFDSSTPWYKHPTTGGNVFVLDNTGFIGYRYNTGQVAPALMDTDLVSALGANGGVDDNAYGRFGITLDSQVRVFRGEYDSSYTSQIFNEQMVGNHVYGALVTPTDTTITDTNLIAQLEAIRTASLENGSNTITNTATGTNLAGDMEIGYYGYNPRNRYDKWLWLDINNEYEQIGS